MPFLFVDYEQGMGGEYFCLELSTSSRCVPLHAITTGSGRIKIQDKFNQEWLKPDPNPQPQSSDPVLFDLVPCHRHTARAKKTLQTNLKSIRLATPSSLHLQSWIKDNQRRKVNLSTLPSTEYFFGELKILQSAASNPKTVASCRKDMDYATLFLISQEIEPTIENKVRFVQQRFDKILPDPIFEYDLILHFEDLIFNRQSVIDKINATFGLELPANRLQRFQDDYFEYALSR